MVFSKLFSDIGLLIIRYLKQIYEYEILELKSKLAAYESYNEECKFENDEYITLHEKCYYCSKYTYSIDLYTNILYEKYKQCYNCAKIICYECFEKNKIVIKNNNLYCIHCL